MFAGAHAAQESGVSTIVRNSPSPEYTHALAAGLASLLRPGDVVRLEGDLGAGKTTLVRGIADALHAGAGMVSSPTFVLVNEYPVPPGARAIGRLVHVDAYRLRSGEDLDALGWDRFIHGASARPDCVVLIEWPERIEHALPADAIRVRLAATGKESRRIEIDWPAALQTREGFPELRDLEPKICPVSGGWVEPTRPSYPFAGEREKLADLNRWFTGSYQISRDLREEDLQEGA